MLRKNYTLIIMDWKLKYLSYPKRVTLYKAQITDNYLSLNNKQIIFEFRIDQNMTWNRESSYAANFIFWTKLQNSELSYEISCMD